METKEYYFYAISDAQKEKIAKAKATSVEEATKTFAVLKGLSPDEFKKIYSVDEWKS